MRVIVGRRTATRTTQATATPPLAFVAPEFRPEPGGHAKASGQSNPRMRRRDRGAKVLAYLRGA